MSASHKCPDCGADCACDISAEFGENVASCSHNQVCDPFDGFAWDAPFDEDRMEYERRVIDEATGRNAWRYEGEE